MKITVCSLWTEEFKLFGPKSEANKRAYCELHGYDFVCQTNKIDTGRPPSWQKLLLLQNVLSDGNWAFWIDADAIFTNFDIKLESLIQEAGSADFFIAKDRNGINAGVFGIRDCEWSSDFIRRCWEQEQFIDHRWWEQAAMMHLFQQPEDNAHVCVFAKRKINSYISEWQPGDFIIHFPATKAEKRLEYINRFDPLSRDKDGMGK